MTAPVKGANWYGITAMANNTVDVSIFDEIGGWGVSAADFIMELSGHAAATEVNLSIHSPGGSVFDGLAIYNALKNHPAKINVYIAGLAASMASAIAMAGDTITIPEDAFMMVHCPRGGAVGKADEMRDYADLLDQAENTLINIYAKKTGLPLKEIGVLLSAESWMAGPECVKKGFADKLAEPVKVAATANPEAFALFANLPASAKKLIGKATPSTEAKQIAALLDDKTRRDEIAALLEGYDDHPQIASLISDGTFENISSNEASKILMQAIGSTKTPSAAQIHVGNGAIIHDGMVDALSARVGLSTLDDKQNHFRGMTLMELARASLTEVGVGIASMGGRMDIVAAAFTHSTGDFTGVLENVAAKALLAGWDASGETFDRWTKKGELWDFKEAKRAGLGSMPSLPEVKEGAEYKYVTTDDRSIPIALATYGGMFSLTRQAIINDDLSAFDRVPQALGRAAHRTIGDLVYAILTSNAKYSVDNKALFHADHNNIVTGTFDAALIDAARLKIRTQKDAQGERLSINPGFLIVPAAREGAAYSIINSTSPEDAANSGIVSPVHKAAEIVVESRLDDVSAATEYLLASKGSDTIEVAFLDGIDRPALESKDGWDVDGTCWKVRIDAGVAPLDFRGMVRLSDS
ncbi:MAG: ClpP-like prohead protease/major capsid protein fusion protein [Halioglobus sp.]